MALTKSQRETYSRLALRCGAAVAAQYEEAVERAERWRRLLAAPSSVFEERDAVAKAADEIRGIYRGAVTEVRRLEWTAAGLEPPVEGEEVPPYPGELAERERRTK